MQQDSLAQVNTLRTELADSHRRLIEEHSSEMRRLLQAVDDKVNLSDVQAALNDSATATAEQMKQVKMEVYEKYLDVQDDLGKRLEQKVTQFEFSERLQKLERSIQTNYSLAETTTGLEKQVSRLSKAIDTKLCREFF